MAWFPADWALRSSVLVAACGGLLWLSRTKEAAVRLAAWTTILCASLAIPLGAALPAIRLLPPPHPMPVSRASYLVIPGGSPARATTGPTPALSRAIHWEMALAPVYAGVAATLLLRIALGVILAGRLLRASRYTGRDAGGIPIRESELVSSPAALGILRPAIVLPADWPEWSGEKLAAVLAHERSHIERRDPAVQLLSAIHRALLWHSPMSWYLHRRIVHEAEAASDDAAVAEVGNAEAYAEVLLQFIGRGVRRPAWRGLAMARYGRPEERIDRILDGTSFSRGITRRSMVTMVTLAAPFAWLVAVAGRPQSDGRTADPTARFEAASVKVAFLPDAPTPAGRGDGPVVKLRPAGAGRGRADSPSGGPGTSDPGRIHFPQMTLEWVLLRAFEVNNFQIAGADWLGRARYDIDATMPPDTTAGRFHAMLQNLLVERFKMQFHRETKELSGYAMVAARGGPKFKESALKPASQSAVKPDDVASELKLGADGYFVPPDRPGVFLQLTRPPGARSTFRQVTMATLASALQSQLRSPVQDDTGLTGKYDFVLDFSMEGLDLGGGRLPVSPGASGAETLPDLFTALQGQLGLKLNAKRIPVEVIVIDHIEKVPVEN